MKIQRTTILKAIALFFVIITCVGEIFAKDIPSKKKNWLSNIFKKREQQIQPLVNEAIILTVPKFTYILISDSLALINAMDDITPIYDTLRSFEFTEIPEEYDIWSEDQIDPYKVKTTDLDDSIKIDVSGYYHPAPGYITSDFGVRRWRMHTGVDLKVDRGDSIRCAFDGVVRIAKRMRGGYGIFVVVRHNNGLETLYGHLSKTLVEVNTVVTAGTPLGLGGSTGRSTGNHLHFEFRYLGNTINPHDIIDFDNKTAKNRLFTLTADNFKYKIEAAKTKVWVIRRGDTLGRISIKTGVPISNLCKMNGIKRTTKLKIGRRLRYS